MNVLSATTVRGCILTWALLVGLQALTMAAAFMPLPIPAVACNVAISLIQASLVLTFSMHLRSAHPVLRLFAISGFFGILLEITLTLADVLTR